MQHHTLPPALNAFDREALRNLIRAARTAGWISWEITPSDNGHSHTYTQRTWRRNGDEITAAPRIPEGGWLVLGQVGGDEFELAGRFTAERLGEVLAALGAVQPATIDAETRTRCVACRHNAEHRHDTGCQAYTPSGERCGCPDIPAPPPPTGPGTGDGSRPGSQYDDPTGLTFDRADLDDSPAAPRREFSGWSVTGRSDIATEPDRGAA